MYYVYIYIYIYIYICFPPPRGDGPRRSFDPLAAPALHFLVSA